MKCNNISNFLFFCIILPIYETTIEKHMNTCTHILHMMHIANMYYFNAFKIIVYQFVHYYDIYNCWYCLVLFRFFSCLTKKKVRFMLKMFTIDFVDCFLHFLHLVLHLLLILQSFFYYCQVYGYYHFYLMIDFHSFQHHCCFHH